jgi:hypothetical protein
MTGKRLGPPGLDGDGVAVLEAAHVQLAGGHVAVRPVRASVDEHAALATDAFAAVVFIGDHLFVAQDELLVEVVECFQERHVFVQTVYFVFFKGAFGLWAVLPPYAECDFHTIFIFSPHEAGLFCPHGAFKHGILLFTPV